MTPGEFNRKYSHSYEPIKAFGIPTPPQQLFTTDEEMLDYAHRTGKPGIALVDERYHDWAIKFNQWIVEHPELAEDYDIESVDENYRVWGTKP